MYTALIPSRSLSRVLMANEPLRRTCTRPTWVPAVLSLAGTTARTRSPVLKPHTCFRRILYPRGDLSFVQLVRQCSPRPLAVITSVLSWPGLTPASSPTHRASRAWLFSTANRSRFHLVRPPVQVPRGRPKQRKDSTSLNRVEFTAAASLRGRLACTSTSGWPNSAAVWFPFSWLQE